MRSILLVMAVIALIVSTQATAAEDTAAPALKVLKTLPLGGEGRWDYLCADAQGERLDLIALFKVVEAAATVLGIYSDQ